MFRITIACCLASIIGCVGSPDSLGESPDVYPVPSEVRTSRFALPGGGTREVTYGVIGKHGVIDGDIVFELDEDSPRAAAVYDFASRWPGGIMPYRIDPALPDPQRVLDAIAHIEANTSFRFRPRTSEPDFVNIQRFVPPPDVSYSYSSWVGRMGGMQVVGLTDGSDRKTAIHELAHAIGLFHEQSRADRDRFVVINWSNIRGGFEGNFRTYLELGASGVDSWTYDYRSIMHYRRDSFSVNGLDTITPIDPGASIGTATVLGTSDINAINYLVATQVSVGVSLEGGGSVTVTSEPAGIQCPGQCAAWFAPWQPVTLTASASAGTTFDGWGACTSGSGATCNITLSDRAPRTATAWSHTNEPPPTPHCTSTRPLCWCTDTCMTRTQCRLTCDL